MPWDGLLRGLGLGLLCERHSCDRPVGSRLEGMEAEGCDGLGYIWLAWAWQSAHLTISSSWYEHAGYGLCIGGL